MGLLTEQKEELSYMIQDQKNTRTVSLEHALVLVKHLTFLKIKNMEL